MKKTQRNSDSSTLKLEEEGSWPVEIFISNVPLPLKHFQRTKYYSTFQKSEVKEFEKSLDVYQDFKVRVKRLAISKALGL